MRNTILVLLAMAGVAYGVKVSSGSYTIGTGGNYASVKIAADSCLDQTGDLKFTLLNDLTENAVAAWDHKMLGYKIVFDGNGKTLTYTPNSSDMNLSVEGPGDFIIDNTKIISGFNQTPGQVVLSLVGNSGSIFNLIVTRCYFDGNGNNGSGAIRRYYDKASLKISNNVFLDFDTIAIFDAAGSYLYGHEIFNNTFFNCDGGINASAAGPGGSRGYRIYNNVFFNCLPAVKTPTKAVVYCNISSDTTVTDSLTGDRGDQNSYYVLGTMYGNQSLQKDTSWFASVTESDTNFLRLKSAKRNYGSKQFVSYSPTYLNGTSVINDSMDVGAYGLIKTLPSTKTGSKFTNRISIVPTYKYDRFVNVKIPFKTGMQASYNDLRFSNRRGTKLEYGIDSSTTDTAWARVTSSSWIDDTVWCYYGNSTAIKGGDYSYAMFAGGGFGKNMNESKWWNFNTPRRPDIVEDTTSNSYELGGSTRYNLAKTKRITLYRSSPGNQHAFDSLSVIRRNVWGVNPLTGAESLLVHRDTAISQYLGDGTMDDERMSNGLGVFNLNGVETWILFVFNTYWRPALDPDNWDCRRYCKAYVSTNECQDFSGPYFINNPVDTATAICCHPKLGVNDGKIHTIMYSSSSGIWHASCTPGDWANWSVNLLYDPRTVANTSLNESECVELKTGSRYTGRWRIISRNASATIVYAPYYCISNDNMATITGGPYNASMYLSPSGGFASPHAQYRLADQTLIDMFGTMGGDVLQSGGKVWKSLDEGASYQFIGRWNYRFGYGILYPSFDEFSNGRVVITWNSNVTTSDQFTNFYDLNTRIIIDDTLSGQSYRPPDTNGVVSIGNAIDTTKYLFGEYEANLQQPNTSAVSYGSNGSLKPVTFVARVRVTDATNFGLHVDTTDGLIPGKRLDFVTLTKDSVFAVQTGDLYGNGFTPVEGAWTTLRVDWKTDSVWIWQDGVRILSKGSAIPNYTAQWLANLQAATSRLDLKYTYVMPYTTAADAVASGSVQSGSWGINGGQIVDYTSQQSGGGRQRRITKLYSF
jgi:hypothetical protein